MCRPTAVKRATFSYPSAHNPTKTKTGIGMGGRSRCQVAEAPTGDAHRYRVGKGMCEPRKIEYAPSVVTRELILK